jgi:hypothetical protein
VSPGIGIVELAGGALIVLGVFAAFMVWAVFPLIPFALMGVAYATVRYGVPALARGAVVAERSAVQAVRWTLFPLAVWALRAPMPAAVAHGEGKGER